MSVKSAKSGTVTFGTLQADVTDISINDVQDLHAYGSSSTGGVRKRVTGYTDATGSFTVLNDVLVTVSKGAVDDLVITSDGTEELYSGQVVIGDITYGVPIGDGSPVETVINWEASPA